MVNENKVVEAQAEEAQAAKKKRVKKKKAQAVLDEVPVVAQVKPTPAPVSQPTGGFDTGLDFAVTGEKKEKKKAKRVVNSDDSEAWDEIDDMQEPESIDIKPTPKQASTPRVEASEKPKRERS